MEQQQRGGTDALGTNNLTSEATSTHLCCLPDLDLELLIVLHNRLKLMLKLCIPHLICTYTIINRRQMIFSHDVQMQEKTSTVGY